MMPSPIPHSTFHILIMFLLGIPSAHYLLLRGPTSGGGIGAAGQQLKREGSFLDFLAGLFCRLDSSVPDSSRLVSAPLEYYLEFPLKYYVGCPARHGLLEGWPGARATSTSKVGGANYY